MTAIQKTVNLEIDWCYSCGNPIALTEQWRRACREEGKTFYCPLGHGQVYADSENNKLRKKLEAAQERTTQLETKLRDTEQMLTVETRARKTLVKRVQNGVCIHCTRSFQNLARHMKTKHPETV